MLRVIDENYPEIHRARSLFGKTQSSFMDNMLTVSHPTPLRNIRQVLAEVNKSTEALKEVYYRNKRLDVEIKILNRDIEIEEDELKKELMCIDIEENKSKLEASKIYVSGAIRKISNYIEQYNSILEKIGVDDFSEIDFEHEEEKYHIMKAFDQALTAARSNPGMFIDEGNHIYLNQIGVNGAHAQVQVMNFLLKERKIMTEGKEPRHELVTDFLNEMADKFKDCSNKLATIKGMSSINSGKALLNYGDKSLLTT